MEAYLYFLAAQQVFSGHISSSHPRVQTVLQNINKIQLYAPQYEKDDSCLPCFFSLLLSMLLLPISNLNSDMLFSWFCVTFPFRFDFETHPTLRQWRVRPDKIMTWIRNAAIASVDPRKAKAAKRAKGTKIGVGARRP